MRTRQFGVAVGTILLGGALGAPALADSFSITPDQVYVAAYSSGVGSTDTNYFSGGSLLSTSGGHNWGDAIGSNYNTSAIDVTRNLTTGNGSVTLTMHTLFNGNQTLGSVNIRYADIFIDTKNTTTPADGFSYAISLGGQALNGNGGKAAGVYSVASSADYKTSYQIWSQANHAGFTYGGLYGRASDLVPSTSAPVVATGAAFDPNDLSVVVGAYDSVAQTVSVTISGTDATGKAALASIFGNFDILWGTGDCSNDAIWGNSPTTSAPEPASLALLGFGTLGLAYLRRRRSV